MSYDIETKLASKNGWQTPAEAKAYYGSYSRDNYIAHWWGAPGTVGTHDETVAYIQRTAAAGTMSVNFVVSDAKITMLVEPANVSWGAESGNPTGINVEHDPALSDQGYKRAGWLKWHLEQIFGKQLDIKKHSDYFATACPGTVDTARIEHECELLREGGDMTNSLTKEEVQEIHQLAFQGDYPPDSVVAAWTGKDLGAYLRFLHQGGSWISRTAGIKALQASVNVKPTVLQPGTYQVG